MQIGASVNELYQAKEGLMPDQFPAGTPVYTGHYHKPHCVPGTSIHYIGSPYQGTPPLLCTLQPSAHELASIEMGRALDCGFNACQLCAAGEYASPLPVLGQALQAQGCAPLSRAGACQLLHRLGDMVRLHRLPHVTRHASCTTRCLWLEWGRVQ